jgi:hypothetical protein
MNPIETSADPAQDPVEEGWIALAPVHVFLWVLLLIHPLQRLLLEVLPYEFQGRAYIAWIFSIFGWGLGLFAMIVAFRIRKGNAVNGPRNKALALGTAALGMRICWIIASQALSHMGIGDYLGWQAVHAFLALTGFAALVLLLANSEKDAGGPFDAAVAALACSGDLGQIVLPILAIAAVKGHPLLAAQWQASREFTSVLRGDWFDGFDQRLRMRNHAGCALACAAFAAGLTGLSYRLFGEYGSRLIPYLWWDLVDIAAIVVASLTLSVHVIRSNHREGTLDGQGLAITAIPIAALPVLISAGIFLFRLVDAVM